MERFLVVCCPSLAEEDEHGRAARTLVEIVRMLEEICPTGEVIRPGVSALRTRGPARYFGGDQALAEMVAERITKRWVLPGMGIGVADGVFTAMLAATTADRPSTDGRRGADGGPPVLVIPPGGSASFLAPLPVDTLERPELADLLHRLGIDTLGRFAAVPSAHVLARFGTEVVRCHEVAAAKTGELPGLRRPSGAQAVLAEMHRRPAPRQGGFWGDGNGRTARALVAAAAVADMLGPESVLTGRTRGGRGPADQARLLPWQPPGTPGADIDVLPSRRREGGSPEAGGDPGPAPWPGQIPPPAPMLVPHRPPRAELVDCNGRVVEVMVSGTPTGAPDQLSVAGKRWTPVISWSGPWPVDEGWWRSSRRRRARMQVATATGAYLLWRDREGWWVEGIYD
jgi:hypothetical protein